MAKEKLYRSVNGDYLYLFNWIGGGFNDVWAPSKKEAYKLIVEERLESEIILTFWPGLATIEN